MHSFFFFLGELKNGERTYYAGKRVVEGMAEGKADLEPLDVGEVAGDTAEHCRGHARAGEVEGADPAAGCNAGKIGLGRRVETDEAECLDGATWEDRGCGGRVAAKGAEAGHVRWEEAEWAGVVAELEVEKSWVVAQDGLGGLADAVEREAAQIGEAEGREESCGRRGGHARRRKEGGNDVVGEAEGERERVEVPESRHERLGDVLCDQEE